MGRGRSSYAKGARSGGTKSARRTTRKASSTRWSITPRARITCTRSSTQVSPSSQLALLNQPRRHRDTETQRQSGKAIEISLQPLCLCGSVADFDLYLLHLRLIQFGSQPLRFFDPLLEARVRFGAQRPELIEIALGLGVAEL